MKFNSYYLKFGVYILNNSINFITRKILVKEVQFNTKIE